VILEEADPERRRAAIGSLLKEAFRPEFINRVDEIIVFHELNEAHLAQIVGIMLKEVQDRIAQNGYQLTVTDAAKAVIAQEGFDPVFGARPLRRAIQHLVEDELAERILAGQFAEGAHVLVDARDGQLVFLNYESQGHPVESGAGKGS
jgi:ATP-dependent Clp protease ATP-binding subunit ClpC